MNGEEVKYLRQNIYVAASGIGGLVVLSVSLVVDSPIVSWGLVAVAIMTFSFIRAIEIDGYSRRIWGRMVTFPNPPLKEQKQLLEGGEEL